MECQYPISKESNEPKCKKEATHYDYWGYCFCDEHSEGLEIYNVDHKALSYKKNNLNVMTIEEKEQIKQDKIGWEELFVAKYFGIKDKNMEKMLEEYHKSKLKEVEEDVKEIVNKNNEMIDVLIEARDSMSRDTTTDNRIWNKINNVLKKVYNT